MFQHSLYILSELTTELQRVSYRWNEKYIFSYTRSVLLSGYFKKFRFVMKPPVLLFV